MAKGGDHCDESNILNEYSGPKKKMTKTSSDSLCFYSSLEETQFKAIQLFSPRKQI